MVGTLVSQLTRGMSADEMKAAGLGDYYTDHGVSVYPQSASGNPFTAAYIGVKGDPVADLYEDMAAEQKARAVYENLIDLTDDPDVIDVLLFLRQREVVHFNRFKELYEYFINDGTIITWGWYIYDLSGIFKTLVDVTKEKKGLFGKKYKLELLDIKEIETINLDNSKAEEMV